MGALTSCQWKEHTWPDIYVPKVCKNAQGTEDVHTTHVSQSYFLNYAFITENISMELPF